MSADKVVHALKLLKSRLEDKGVVHLVLFGSQARGTSHHDSDVDIAIEVDKSQKFSILDLIGVEQLISESTGIPANAFMKRALDTKFSSEIDRDGIKIF